MKICNKFCQKDEGGNVGEMMVAMMAMTPSPPGQHDAADAAEKQ